jgi:dihydrofolate synthase/folylpolyglutamate synthase
VKKSRTGAYLDGRARLGIKFGLESMRALVGELGHPERTFPTLLIAGTNGKGSVAAYVDAVLRACGLRVGLYTSPHLVRVHERIVVDARPITGAALARAVGRVRDAAEKLVARGALSQHPTYFEVLTAAALVHFESRRVDVAVLEVGLGGRLDATNVVEPVASAIVSIDLDHQEFLGGSLREIAAEKAGVLRAGRTTVLGPLASEAQAEIHARAGVVGARLAEAEGQTVAAGEGGTLDLSTPSGRYPGLRSLPGAHQRDNLGVAVRLLEAAREAGVCVDLSRLAEGTAATRWPGRLERIDGHPPLLLDGAHNPAGARTLAAELRRLRPFVLLFGAMADKDVEGITRPLFPLADGLVLTAPRIDRAASPAELQARGGESAKAAVLEKDPRRALRVARRMAGAKGLVVVAGSLYLVGEVKALLEKERRLSGRRVGAGSGSGRGRRGCPNPPARRRSRG